MGNLSSNLKYGLEGAKQMWPPKPVFSTEQMPDLSGRVVIVTGGNTGIGKETVKALLEHNAKVYLGARSPVKAHAAIADLKASTGKEAIFLELDLSSLASVRRAAEEFKSKEPELHILFNNAGTMWNPIDQLTVDGFDMQFGTNVIGHFLFTELLVPVLAAGAKSSPDGHSRIVTTSSNGAYAASIDYMSFRDGPVRRKIGTRQLYQNSKLGNAVVAHEAAKRYAKYGILSFSCNPGPLKTELSRQVGPFTQSILDLFLYPAPLGALTQLYAGTMPKAVAHNGEFFIPWARVGKCRHEVYDPKVGAELWEYLHEQTRSE